MGWVDSLSGKVVGLDTAPVIYYIELRAFHKIRTPDSIQVATAITMEAAFFLTNDTRLPSLPNLKILMLDDLLKEGQEKES